MANIRRSLIYSFADSYLALPLQLIGTMLISRLLTPAETGVFAVGAVFASIASTFRDFGVQEYLIQEKDLNTDHIRASLTVNILASWTMGFILFFGAPFAADFYRTPGVAEVMRVQAFNFALIPFGAVTMAYFRRQLDFRPIFIASLLTNLTTFTVSNACALLGFGYMSLAWSSLAGVVVTVATSLWFRPTDFPRWPGLRGIKKAIHFGKFASGIFILGQIGKGAPEMIIGRAQDIVGVALFSRGSGLVEIFNRTVLRSVVPVCLPYFAKNNREQGSIIDGYLKSISYLTAIGWPFLAFVGILAYSAVRIVYGAQWMSSVPLAQILCVTGSIELVHYLAKDALVAIGGIKRSNFLQMGIQGTRIAGLLAVIPFGLTGACWGLLAAALLGSVYAQWHLNRAIGLKFGDVVASCRKSFYIAILSVIPIALWVGIEGISVNNYLSIALGGGAITGTIWILTLRYFKHPLWGEIQMLLEKLVARFQTQR